MSDKVIIYSWGRCGSRLIFGLYLENGYWKESTYPIQYQIDCNCVYHSHSHEWTLFEDSKDWNVIMMRRTSFNDQFLSYMQALLTQEWFYNHPSQQYTNKEKRFTLSRSLFEKYYRLCKHYDNVYHELFKFKDKFKSFRELLFEDVIEQGLEETCKMLDLSSKDCLWNEHKNPRTFDSVFDNKDEIMEWLQK